MYPMSSRTPCGSSVTGMPPTVAVPESGTARVARIRMVVVLPAPLGPTKPKISALGTMKSTDSRATWLPNRLCSAWTSITRAVAPPSRWRRPGHGPQGGSGWKVRTTLVEVLPERPPSGPWGALLPREGGGTSGAIRTRTFSSRRLVSDRQVGAVRREPLDQLWGALLPREGGGTSGAIRTRTFSSRRLVSDRQV